MTDAFRDWLDGLLDVEIDDVPDIIVKPARMGDECNCGCCPDDDA